MTSQAHPASCARGIRKSGIARGLAAQEIADSIYEHCGFTRLKSNRLAHGWTLAEVADLIRAQTEESGADLSRIAHQRVSRWETGHEVPSLRYLEALCRVFRTRPDLLGFGHDYGTVQKDQNSTGVPTDTKEVIYSGAGTKKQKRSVKDSAQSHPLDVLGEDEKDVQRRELLTAALTTTGVALAEPVLAAVREVHRDMERTLSAATTSLSMLDSWEETIEEYGVAFRYVAPARLLCDIAADLVEVRELASRRQPLDIQRRIYHITAQLTGVGALALSDLGQVHEAKAWFRTARAVADETGDRRLRAWVLAKEATELLFNGKSPDLAIELARRAQMVGGSSPSAGLAIAYSAEARAHSALGRSREATVALARAKDQFSRLPPQATSSSVFAYSQRQLLFHEGDALTTLGASRQALVVHRSTASLYSATEPLEPALIQINEAKCMVREGDVTAACRHAADAIQALPDEYHDTVAPVRAREMLGMVSASLRSQRDVRELTELLTQYGHTNR